MFFPGKRDTKTPAYAVLIASLNLLAKWAPVLVASGFLLADKRKKQPCTPQSRKGPKVKNVGSKTNINHVHRRGKQELVSLLRQSVELNFRLCSLFDHRVPC